MAQVTGITIERNTQGASQYARIRQNTKIDFEYTAKGNRLYRFRPISKEELEKLRVHTYPYLV
ncbi:MAG: hypothetical protein LBO74_13265 [Candidatus Symbiothrix sp.]|jgi:hypothetical protein|nr:hypothetical protein [Candidatus Symbiothrix sp.]